MAKDMTAYQRLIRPPVGRVEFVPVPSMRFLTIGGVGNPNTSKDYQDAIQALYCTAYTLKFSLKKVDESLNFKVSALEGLWWADDMDLFTTGSKDEWKYTMMIMVPDQVSEEAFHAAVADCKRKKGLKSLDVLRLESIDEGLSAQTMYIGPYSAEEPTIRLLHDSIHQNGYVRSGKHHEIYLGDPRTADPARLKTVIRQPVSPA